MILSADHGEAFGGHGTTYHAATLCEELIHVPFIVTGPSIARRRRDVLASLVDVGPTVLDLFGVATPGHFQGEPLVPVLTDREKELTRPLIAESGRKIRAIRLGDFKVIDDQHNGTLQLFDLTRDPAELHDLSEDEPDVARRGASPLRSFFGVHALKKEGYELPYRP